MIWQMGGDQPVIETDPPAKANEIRLNRGTLILYLRNSLGFRVKEKKGDGDSSDDKLGFPNSGRNFTIRNRK